MLPRVSRALRRSERPIEPFVSLVLAVYDPPLHALRGQLAAIAAQSDQRWECIVVDDSSTDVSVLPILNDWVGQDPSRRRLVEREANGGIAAATNDGLDLARGDVVAVVDHDDLIHVDAIECVIAHFEDHPSDAVVYTDELLIDEAGAVVFPYHKPAWSPHRHLGHHYLAHLVAARRDVVRDLRVRAEFEPAQDYDFYLRVIESAQQRSLGVGHIARPLYSWRAVAGSSALAASEKPEMTSAVARCAQAALDRRQIHATASTVYFRGEPTTSCRLEWTPSALSVELVRLEPDTTAAELNQLITAADADVVCLVDDPVLHDREWATPLVDLLDGASIGACGPRIVDAGGTTLLSVGRVVEPFLADQSVGEPTDGCGPWGSLLVERDVSALAPLGFTVRRSVFVDHGGLMTGLGVDAAIAEFCVRLTAAGSPCVWTPAVTLTARTSFGDDGLFDPADAAQRHHDDLAVRASLGSERFDLFGVAGVGSDQGRGFHSAKRKLLSGEIDLVTSDVFDTLVTRAVATPSDLFIHLGQLVDLPAHVPPSVFAAGRRHAEARARRDCSNARRAAMRAEGEPETAIGVDPAVVTPEVSLDEIWERMPDSWGDRHAMQRRELELEGRSLQPIPETLAVLQLARRLDVPVVLVSDIYLSSAQLAAVLADAGVDMSLVHGVVTSCDHRLGKAHGLLERAIADHGATPSRVLHLGDNEVADVRSATRLGAHPVHLDIASEARAVETVPSALRDWSSEQGSDLGISAAIRSVLVGRPSVDDPSYQFGAATIGPALTGFSRWVSAMTTELGASHVHCLLREGGTIADLIDITSPDGPDPIRLHVSRWVTMRAAVIQGTPEELSVALSRRADLTADHVARAFGCDIDRVRSVLGRDVVPVVEVDEACALLSSDEAMRSDIIAGAADLRARVLVYLRARLHRVDGGPIVVADVGWGGTIQEGLTRILRSDGIDDEVIGLYFALSKAGEERLVSGARMHSYLPNRTDDRIAARDSLAIAHHADTIEQILTPPIGTLIDIDVTGKPICREVAASQLSPGLHDARWALFAVARRLADRTLGLTDLNDDRWTHDPGLRAAFASTIAEVVVAPSPAVANSLGSWSHDDVAGADARAIADSSLTEAVTYANANDVERLDPQGRGWIAGVAGRHQPALAAQLLAEHRGIDPERLAPLSPSGIARLAAFELGSDVARIQDAAPARLSPGGWSMLHLAGDVDSLRSLRFDGGELTELVDIGYFSLRLWTTDERPPERSVEMTDSDLVFVDGHPVDRARFVHRAGGHVLLQVEGELADGIRHVEATVGFRCVALDDDSPLLIAPLATRLTGQARRVAGAVRRRL